MSTAPDRVQCHGTIGDSRPCLDRARPGSRYCARHIGQRPTVPREYLDECLSVRPNPTRVHLRYREHGAPLRLLCTGSLARPWQQPPVGLRTCPRCRRLALEAVGRGELEPDTLRRWNLGEPNVDEARR